MVKQKKKKFKMWNKLLAFLGMFVMLTGCLAGTVQAGSYEAGKKGSLNLTVQQTDEDGKTTPLTGVKLELYRVADVSFDGNVHFVLTSSMSSAGYDFDSFKNASEWYSAAEKLAEVAAASSVKPVEAVSDEQGKVVYSDMEEEQAKEKEMQIYLEEALKKEICNIKINCGNSRRISSVVNITLEDCNVQTLMVALDMEGICVSGGSACMSGAMETSHVLKAMGASEEDLKSSIRVSIGRYNTKDEIDIFIQKLKEIVARERAK